VERSEATLALGYGNGSDDPAYRLGAGFCRFLKELSFSVTRLPPAPEPPAPPLFCFNSPEDEVTGICRAIKQQSLDSRLDLAETVVVFPGLQAIAPLASRTFREYGIPATVYPAQDLAASPPVVAVLELLNALETGYERVATTAAFSSEFLPGLLHLSSDKDGCRRAAAAAALNRAACEAGIVKDADAWKHLAERLEPEYSFDDEERAFALDLQKRARQAIGLAEKFMSRPKTLGEFSHGLKQLLEAAGFCHDLKPDEPEAQLLLEDRSELYDILDSIVGFESDFGARPADLTGFTKTFTYLVGLSRRTPERVPRGVLVLSLSETLGLTPRHLFIGGLTETSLPSRYPVDPLLPDSVRRRLDLPDIDWHRDHERFHFERTRNCSPSPPWLSYHAAADAKPVLPTPFLDLEPKNVQPVPGLFSPEEEQRYDGATAGKTLPQAGRPVDFAQDNNVLCALSRSFGPDVKLSVTQLERYRACPYCFYLSDVLGLEELERPGLEVGPQQWGIMVHRALARLYRDGPVPLEQLKQKALASLDDVIAEFGLNRFWAEVTRRLFENSIDDIVECESGLRAEGFLPAGTEVRVEGRVGPDLLLKGRIDRYDESGKRLRVLDYKTGGSGFAGPADVIESRTHLQLPVYSHLLAQGRPGVKVDNMGIYLTRDARVRWMTGDKHPVDVLVRTALENAVETARAIRAGEFPPRPADERTCAECHQAFLCGREELKKD
jgi:ATP-dependent helicase/DNAse subunit B